MLSIPTEVLATVQSDSTVEATLVADSDTYKKGDKVSVCFMLDNYGEGFSEKVTTMLIEIKYDTKLLSPDLSGFKKIANDNGGLGFSHLAESKGVIVYQYLNIVEPLKKGTKEIFCVTFTANTDISATDKIIGVKNAVLQDGSKAESVRYKVNVKCSVNRSVSDVVENESVGDKVYDNKGEVVDKDKYESETFVSELETKFQQIKDEMGLTDACIETEVTSIEDELVEEVQEDEGDTKRTLMMVIAVVAIACLGIGVVMVKCRKNND